MKLTKRIKMRRQLNRPAGRWIPVGYIANRPHRFGKIGEIGHVDEFRFVCGPQVRL